MKNSIIRLIAVVLALTPIFIFVPEANAATTIINTNTTIAANTTIPAADTWIITNSSTLTIVAGITIDNYGKIRVDGGTNPPHISASAIINNGTIRNHPGGRIVVIGGDCGAGGAVIVNFNGGLIRNFNGAKIVVRGGTNTCFPTQYASGNGLISNFGGSFVNQGLIRLIGDSDVCGNVAPGGTITNHSGGTFVNNGGFGVSGEIRNNGGAIDNLSIFSNNGYAIIKNNGAFFNSAGGVVNSSNNAEFKNDFNGAVLAYGGTMTFPVGTFTNLPGGAVISLGGIIIGTPLVPC